MLMILTHIANIGQMFMLTWDQGHKVKSQGQIGAYVKKWKKWFQNQRIGRWWWY